MFSIIIPLHNKANYVKKSIISVLEQTYENFELIIINDGSTDNSLSVIQQFTDPRIEIISQQNQGVSAARNYGVKIAKYNNIAFLDADDWWAPNFLQEMANALKDFPEAGIYGCKYYWVKNGVLKTSINQMNDDFRGYIDYFETYMHAWWMPLTSISVVIKKKIFEEMEGFKENLKFGEDFELWIRIILRYKLAYVNKPIAYYNQDVNINERALGADKLYRTENHFIFNLAFLEEAELSNIKLEKMLDGLRVRALIRYHLSGKYKSETAIEIAKINFEEQSKYYNIIYKYPRFLVRFYFFIKKKGSIIKQILIKRRLFK
jgi:glycosyltransferase involved in cell wall biosynthesis